MKMIIINVGRSLCKMSVTLCKMYVTLCKMSVSLCKMSVTLRKMSVALCKMSVQQKRIRHIVNCGFSVSAVFFDIISERKLCKIKSVLLFSVQS